MPILLTIFKAIMFELWKYYELYSKSRIKSKYSSSFKSFFFFNHHCSLFVFRSRHDAKFDMKIKSERTNTFERSRKRSIHLTDNLGWVCLTRKSVYPTENSGHLNIPNDQWGYIFCSYSFMYVKFVWFYRNI